MASTSLTWTPSGAGSQQKTTLSMWLKKSKPSNAGYIFEINDGLNQFVIRESNAQIKFWHFSGSAYDWEAEISPELKDVNGWYNFVMSIDTTQSTLANRLKCWLNGVSQTVTFTSGSSNFSQNSNWIINKNSTHRWGRADNSYWDGLMSHLHKTDGYCYDASTFGLTDSTTGEWSINANPTIANYGTNGFWILKDGNSVTDQSPNTNNFTVATGTLTFTHDNPSNVFCTLNPLTGRSTPTYLSGNNEVTSCSDGHYVFGTQASKAGYYEIKLAQNPNGSNGNGMTFGVFDANYGDYSLSAVNLRKFQTNHGYTTNYSVTDNGGSLSWEGTTTGVSAAAGDIINVAWKNGKLYCGKNGTYFFSANPSNNTDGSTQVLMNDSSAYQLPVSKSNIDGMNNSEWNFGNGYFGTTAITSNSGNGYQDANGQGKFQYQPPTGCYALCTKNLNL